MTPDSLQPHQFEEVSALADLILVFAGENMRAGRMSPADFPGGAPPFSQADLAAAETRDRARRASTHL